MTNEMLAPQVHTFSLRGRNIAVDVNSGAVHLLDGAAFALLGLLSHNMHPSPPGGVYGRLPGLSRTEIDEAYGELYELYKNGMLFAPADYLAGHMTNDIAGPVKAVCLHVSHDCNLRCAYCFADTGEYHGPRGHMSPQTACAAIDYIAASSRGRRNLEIDFFGGEPLLAFETVRCAVEYARSREQEWGKRFRFTITTNGLALAPDRIEYINRTMDNVVLSLDGRRHVNDALRYDAAGNGSYSRVLPRLLDCVKARGGEQYYVRGTFTAKNLDFADDVLHLADQGFRHISVEPVVCGDPGLAITEKHLERIYAEYDRLAELLSQRKADGRPINFFHFNVDLSQGPCVLKRLRGCGAGSEYVAVTPDGEVYPCHQFVGLPDYRLGSIYDGADRLDTALTRRFAQRSLLSSEECRNCWAKFYCSGGCAAANYKENGDLNRPYGIGCQLERKRLECAIALAAEASC